MNKANDQPYLSSHLLNFTIVNDCHYNFDKSPNAAAVHGVSHGGLVGGLPANTDTNANTHYGSDTAYGSLINLSLNTTNTTTTTEVQQQHTLCYLQETLFQNGQLAFVCAEEKDKKHPTGFHTEYMLQVTLLTF